MFIVIERVKRRHTVFVLGKPLSHFEYLTLEYYIVISGPLLTYSPKSALQINVTLFYITLL